MSKKEGGKIAKEGSTIVIKERTLRLAAIAVIVILLGAFGLSFFTKNLKADDADTLQIGGNSIVQSVSAEELGSKFVCPCCGKSITNMCCGMAKERMTYLESQVDAGLDEDAIILNMVKKYGIASMFESERAGLRQKLIDMAPEDRPQIMLEPTYHDFGDVSVKAGVTSTQMTVKNVGTKDLIIDSLSTSCGCTSASLIVDGIEGPKFSMPGHGPQPTGWSARIGPGQQAKLKIYYDPKVHPQMRGAGTRTIDIHSNDPIDFGKQVKIEFNQIA